MPDKSPRESWPDGYRLLDKHWAELKPPFEARRKAAKKLREARLGREFRELRPIDIFIMLAIAELSSSDPDSSTQHRIARRCRCDVSYVSKRLRTTERGMVRGLEPNEYVASFSDSPTLYRLAPRAESLMDRMFA